MDHPFEIGKEYSNRNGVYKVLAIAEPKMHIRYANGSEDVVTIAIQARIWQALRDEAQAEVQKERETHGRKPRKTTRQGYNFSGLKESDFKHNVAGTHWRSREGLGGRLAQHLSEKSPFEFQSHAIYRRPSVYITIPDHYDPNNGQPYAKYELRLATDGAKYGFYVERAGQSRKMDSTWHWRPFLKALESDQKLQETLLQIMHQHNLFWLLQLEVGKNNNYSIDQEIEISAGGPLLWNKKEKMGWVEFADRLREIPPDLWLNVHLCAWTEKEAAIEEGERFAEKVSAVFRVILPLYLASIGVNKPNQRPGTH